MGRSRRGRARVHVRTECELRLTTRVAGVAGRIAGRAHRVERAHEGHIALAVHRAQLDDLEVGLTPTHTTLTGLEPSCMGLQPGPQGVAAWTTWGCSLDHEGVGGWPRTSRCS